MPATAAVTEPSALVLSNVSVTPVIARFVVVADVPVEFVNVKLVRVEDEEDTKPLSNPMMVDVDTPKFVVVHANGESTEFR